MCEDDGRMAIRMEAAFRADLRTTFKKPRKGKAHPSSNRGHWAAGRIVCVAFSGVPSSADEEAVRPEVRFLHMPLV